MNKLVAITIGDIQGIGIDILIKTWRERKLKNFILISNIQILKKYLKKRNINLNFNLINIHQQELNFVNNKINVFSYNAKSIEDNTYKSLIYGYELCITKRCIGLITLPLRKDIIKNSVDKNFVGHTEFFQKIDKKKYANMILYHKKVIISPLTTHVELKKVSNIISNKTFIYNQIINLNRSLNVDFNIHRPKILISGLNPHAGENGKIGIEEKKILIPVIRKLQKKGIDINGPYSADSILINNNLGKIDCFIFLYHDQALIPFKLISKFSGVNYTSNLNIIRTSPDHGTAYDLVGKRNISNKSFITCYKLINKIFSNRKLNGKT